MISAVHLTEGEIDDYLIGDLADECANHLAVCSECQAHVAELEAPITSFKDVSLAWSERQSATLPVRPVETRAETRHRRLAMAIAAATTAIAIGVAVPLARHGLKAPAPVAHSAPVQTFSGEREEQIAQDNQMLHDIDRELGVSMSSPSETFGLQLGDGGRRSGRNAPIQD